jgi:hypothetical protein
MYVLLASKELQAPALPIQLIFAKLLNCKVAPLTCGRQNYIKKDVNTRGALERREVETHDLHRKANETLHDKHS